MTLCKTTSEGQARTCACELLHALFLVSIATEQQAPDKIKVYNVMSSLLQFRTFQTYVAEEIRVQT